MLRFWLYIYVLVSILVLMDSRIKIRADAVLPAPAGPVSILVLMDSRIKMFYFCGFPHSILSFNPCFNG